ncbi:MAG TPA: hypothetical protein VFY29_20145, partial [Terriglobia bacterium]|nr:hypothetical protein [Terriglobia bacterium]
PGRYKLVAGGREGTRRIVAVREISVPVGGLPEQSLEMQRSVDVIGHLTTPDNIMPDQIGLSLTPRETLTTTLLGGVLIGVASSRAEISPNGDFVVRDVLPGVRYGIGYNFKGGANALSGTLVAARYGGADLLKGSTVFEQGQKKLDATFDSRLGAVRIQVMDQDKPQAGIMTVMRPRGGDAAPWARQSDSRGVVTFADVRGSGDYEVYAIEDLGNESWLLGAFMDQFLEQARIVHIEIGETASTTVQVIKVERGLK